jgi:hypothetical protein
MPFVVATSVVAFAGAMGAGQSPLYDELRRVEGQRKEALEWEHRAALPVAIAYRAGHPLALVSVYQKGEDASGCGAEGKETFVYIMEEQLLYRCRAGERAPFAENLSVILSSGKTQIIEWTGGRVQVHDLR